MSMMFRTPEARSRYFEAVEVPRGSAMEHVRSTCLGLWDSTDAAVVGPGMNDNLKTALKHERRAPEGQLPDDRSLAAVLCREFGLIGRRKQQDW